MVRGLYIGTYKGNSMCGFETGKEYCIQIDKYERGYEVIEKSVDGSNQQCGFITYASENSIRRNWDLVSTE